MAEEVESHGSSLKNTPTWALAVVCFVLISISLLFEHGLHLLTKFLGRNRKSLDKALYKIKSELMLFGFISLALTVSQGPISKICIPQGARETFLPCENTEISSDVVEEKTCYERGKVSLLSRQGVEHLQMLIFALALFHVISCVLTFGLGMAKMKRWKYWEEETTTLEYQYSNDPRRFRLTRQTSFAKRHLKFWSNHHILRWPACFIRQFYGSVSRTDYLILRHGFIMAHLGEAEEFDFQKFIKRALDKDFEFVVGMSLWVWIFAVIFIFFHAHGFYSYFWLPFIPLLTLLLLGTKLQVIITDMCLESRNQSAVVRGSLLVKPNDKLFWFGAPQLVLHLLYFILFQNSFQLSFFSWTWYKYGLRSCFHKTNEDIILGIVVAVLVQLLCGYVTLPLYALVTQMGTSMKKVVFTEQVNVGLRNWHKMAKKNVAASKQSSVHPSRDTSNHNSAHTSRELSPSPSPSYTVDNMVSEIKEFEVAALDRVLPDIGFENVVEKKEQKLDKSKKKEVYNGEISFGWYNDEMRKMPVLNVTEY